MNDERIVDKLSLIKRNNLILGIVLSVFFILVKVFFFDSQQNYLTEMFVLTISILAFIITFIYTPNNDIDERIKENVYLIYRVMFSIAIYGGIGIYFTQLLNQTQISLQTIPTKFFISWLTLSMLLVSYISARNLKIYFNYEFIEMEDYYKHIKKRIVRYLLICICYLIYLGMLTIFISDISSFIVVSIVLIFSFVSYIIQYFLFSAYEKNHYDEDIMKSKGKIRYVTKNVLILLLIGLFYFLLFDSLSILNQLYHESRASDPNTSSILQLSLYLNHYVRLFRIDKFIISLFVSILIYKSLKLLPNANYAALKLFLVASIVVFVYSFCWFIFDLIYPIVAQAIEFNYTRISILRLYMNYIRAAIDLTFMFLIYLYIINHKIPIKRRYVYYMFLKVFYIFSIFFVIFIGKLITDNPFKIMIYQTSINLIIFTFLSIYYILMIRKLTRITIDIPIKFII